MAKTEKNKCEWPGGMTVLLDGVHELDPCVYEEVETIHNVTAHVLRCKQCGHIELEFTRQDEWSDEPDWKHERWTGDEYLSDEV